MTVDRFREWECRTGQKRDETREWLDWTDYTGLTHTGQWGHRQSVDQDIQQIARLRTSSVCLVSTGWRSMIRISRVSSGLIGPGAEHKAPSVASNYTLSPTRQLPEIVGRGVRYGVRPAWPW